MERCKHSSRRRRRRTFKQYSKRVIKVMIFLWFIVAFFTMGVILYQLKNTPEYVNLDGLLNFVGYPMSGGIVGYLIKSAIENRTKIKSNPEYLETEEN